MSSTVAAGAVCSAGAAVLDDAVFAVTPGVAGVAAPEVPGGGLFDGAPEDGAFGGALVAGALVAGPGGVLPVGEEAGEVPGDGVVPFDPDCSDGTVGMSALPRMIGKPSLPVPITTIFAFGDCASMSVASMPRQRK